LQEKVLTGRTHHYDIVSISWNFPPEEWVKLNRDGSHKESTNIYGYGGLLLDRNDKHLKGFSRKIIGSCDALHAEIWGMYIGMILAWKKGLLTF
jgi:hypothetical protein